jgi:hypothetical protein
MVFRRLSKRLSQSFKRSESENPPQDQPLTGHAVGSSGWTPRKKGRNFSELPGISEVRPYVRDNIEWEDTQRLRNIQVPRMGNNETRPYVQRNTGGVDTPRASRKQIPGTEDDEAL